MVNPERSALARLAARWIRGRRHVADHAVADVLTDVRPGREVRLTGFAQVMPRERWAHLQAYGLTPGCSVRVVQHTPITVVQIGHLELALEADLARQIQVEAVLTGRSG
jgi:Fe2+ transport system protein FeoA